MQFKDGVDLALAPKMARALPAIDRAFEATVGHECTITSAHDGVHSAHSLHYAGLAVDVRTRDLTKEQIETLAKALRETLGKDFDVVVETDHIHIEYDPE